MRKLGALVLIGTVLQGPAFAAPWPQAGPWNQGSPPPGAAQTAYRDTVRRVAEMVQNPQATTLASKHGLGILNVLWEDTGRYQGSSVGPNISDVTIEVELKDETGQRRTALMPVMRYPNFVDKTGDVPLDRIWIPVGNQVKGGNLAHVSLRELLRQPTRYMTLPQKGQIRGGSLLAERDGHALVSAQATFLPIPKNGGATFWPVIFNYQSTAGDPAVLTLLVTRQGTSLTIVDNARDTIDGGSWGQRLFFNAGGQRAPLTAERLSQVKAKGVTANGEAAASLGADANLLMIIQVPLKVRRPPPRYLYELESAAAPMAGAPAMAPPAAPSEEKSVRARRSDVEVAVLGHGPKLGPYTELDGLTIERDPRFPVRVTVQFYQATSNGVVSDENVALLATQIGKVYDSADFVGSLVVPAPKDLSRPTNWDGVGPPPPGMRCEDFPALVARGRCRPAQAATPGGPVTPATAGIH